MSKTVDERVVSMQFDNAQFERGVSTTMSTLDKLKQSLKLDGASKGLESVQETARRFDFSGISSGVENIKMKFSALEVMAMTALGNITNSAVNAGKRLVSAFTIDPIKSGFQEYETQINAVQTILANTESKGSTLQDVNNALAELNTYADKTIYNFTEMTRNIGTFTAAGVDLNTSVTAIKGIANLAAVSGSTSQQASTAMYQLSQALASGTVKLQDWNSVVNAGMGGQVFQDALKETARVHGVAIDSMIKEEGSFRETLQKGWLTTDILTETLNHFTMAAEEGSEEWENYKKSLMDSGYTEKQAEAILKLSNTATDAATKVKTFSQLMDTLKESAQSGWTKSWEIMIGDFEEAKDFLTDVSNRLGEMIGGSADARNKVLSEGLSSGWKQLLNAGISDEEGYKDIFKSVAKEQGVSIDNMIKAEKKLDESLTDTEAFQKALKKGFSEGKISSDMLTESVHKMADKMSKMSDKELKAAGYTKEHVEQIKKLSAGLKDGSISMDDFAKKITSASGRENIIQSLWNAFDGLMSVIKPIKEAFSEVFPSITGEQILNFTQKLKDFTAKLKLSGETASKVKDIFKGIFSVFDIFRKVIVTVTKSLFNLSGSSGIKSLASMLLDAAAAIGRFFTSVNEGFKTDGLAGGLSKITSTISDMIQAVVGKLGGFGEVLSKIGSVVSKVAKSIWNSIKTVFTWITDNISAGDIFAGLAGGGIFVAAKKFTGLIQKVKDIIENLFGDKDKGSGGGFLDEIKEKVSGVLDSLKESLQSFTAGIKIASLLAIAIAVGILTHSIKTLSEIKFVDVSRSLVAIGIMLKMLSESFKSLTKSLSKYDSKGVVKSALAMVVMAYAIKVLADALVKISALSLEEIAKGLIGIGGGLAELSVALKYISKEVESIPLKTTIAMIALAKCCKLLADALIEFAVLSWDEIGRGLTAMGGALGELVLALKVLDKVKIPLKTTISMVAMALILKKLAEALQDFGSMQWDEIGRGLVAMGGALGEVTGVVAILSKIGGWSSILGSASIWISVQSLQDLYTAFQQFGSMSWSEIGRGLVAMGGALAEVSGISGALGKLAGLSGIIGGAAIWTTVQSLQDLATAFQQFGSMQWDEIGRGLVAMGGALAEVSTISGALGKLAGLSGIIGGAAIWTTVQSLQDLATAFQQFGSMQWDEIGRGLVAMGGALGEVSVISGALGSLAGLAGIIGGAAIWTSVQGLGDLADALKKFGEMQWDEIGRGLTAMGGALGEVALGSLLNTLSGLGAAAIAEVAGPLGQLADSVKKWTGVTVPEGLSEQLGSLASGVMKFTFGGSGAGALAEAAAPLGTMADSVKKWTGVTVPEGLNEQLSTLASGVRSFVFTGMGAGALAEAAAPLGTMADSVKKWCDVTIPDTLQDDLTSLSTGIKSFSWAFMGGWSLSAISGPLGDLVDDVKKWKDVKIPKTLKDDLTSLADGIKSFSWAFMGGWSLSAISGPLGDLANAVKKISTTDTSKVDSFVSAVKKIAEIKIDASTLTEAASSVSKAVSNMMKAIDTTITNSKSSISKSMKTAMGGMTSSIKSATTEVKSATNSLLDSFVNAIKNKKSSTKSAFKSLVSDAADAIKDKKSSIKSAGKDLGEGLVEGINAKQQAVYDAAYALGQKAVQGEKDGQKSNSPSKETIKSGKWFGEGLVIGIKNMASKVYNAGHSLGETATNSLSSAVSKIADVIDSDIDTQPTIRPVLDLSNVRTGAGTIGTLLGTTNSIGVLSNVRAINSMMNRSQNRANDDVISAIKDLGREIGNSSGDTYNVNGVSYNDDNAVSDAIKTIVRAARVERRV